MKVYRGRRIYSPAIGGGTTSHCVVTVMDKTGERLLDYRLDLANKSPTGFEWGYCGSGPAQLAVALVADQAGDSFAIPTVYQRLKEDIVARFPKDGWVLLEDTLEILIDKICEDHQILRPRPRRTPE